jgi:hypothetical protein
MAKKPATWLTLFAFFVFSCSCAIRTKQKLSPGDAYGEQVKILGLMRTSGEYFEFPEKQPGRIEGDRVVGRIIGQGETTIPLVQVEKISKTNDGQIIEIETTDGKTYVGGRIIREDKDQLVIHPALMDFSIPLKDIEFVWVKKIDPGLTFLATIGGIGLTLAAIVVIIVLTKESCPFIYSFNGERYIFDAEPFGGAICEGLKRTEWCALEEIKEIDGRYHILITNEVDETQYTDELKLVVVDHAPGIQVVSDALGTMHSVSDPLPPRRAVDSKGRDLLPVVGTNDWKFWLNRTTEMSQDMVGPAKEELTFEFPKPEGARTARLIFNGCTTLWGSQMIKKLLELYGNSVQEWYHDVNGRGPSLMKTMLMDIREELYQLHIRVETPDGWTSKGLIQGGGPLISENRLYSFDISDVPGDALRIKLTPASTYWMINSLAVDYSEDQTLIVNEVAPLEARDELGRDVRDLLLVEDGRYLVMPRTGDRTEVSFLSPPRQEGSRRSIFVKAGGYYDIHLEAKAAPQTELIQKIFAEPGFITRYAIKEYLKWRAEAAQEVRARSH